MKRFVKAAAMTAASCAVVLSGAGVASASDGNHGSRHHNHNRHYHDHYRNDHRGLYNHRSGANGPALQRALLASSVVTMSRCRSTFRSTSAATASTFSRR